MKPYDCTIIVSAHEVGGSIEKCLRSIFMQKADDHRVLIIVAYINSKDNTFNKILELSKECPAWAEYRFVVNTDKVQLSNKDTLEQQNFYHGFKAAKGKLVMFCSGRHSWINKTKMRYQLKHYNESGVASYTQPILKAMPENYNPALHGDLVVFSSLSVPANLKLQDVDILSVFFEWFCLCACYAGPGLKYVNMNQSVNYAYKNRYILKAGTIGVLRKSMKTLSALNESGIQTSDSKLSLIYRIVKYRIKLIAERVLRRQR